MAPGARRALGALTPRRRFGVSCPQRVGALTRGGGRQIERGDAMPWEKPSPELTRKLDDAVAAAAQASGVAVELKPMFGCPAYFVNGNLFAGVHQSSLMLRLPEDRRAEVIALGGGPFEPMPGRAMKEYVVLPSTVLGDASATAAWVRRGAEHAASLPPKAKKPRKKSEGRKR
jgi:TfoX/Sxy family transcriptional regulator of competence genes